ncbi:MAG: hypothetical protein IB618_00810 [Candidatus Pacearchaeota archaeon]|nr:MAG: hypothetical protein IB618_00810 [Candidatus Pacearchaeota archaeon]
MAKRLSIPLILLLTLGSIDCAKKVYIDKYGNKLDIKVVQRIQESEKGELVRRVSFPDIKTWTKGTLETDGLRGCFCVVGLYIKDGKKFGLMSHYQSTQVDEHLNTIRIVRDFWPQMQDYDSAVLVAFRQADDYLPKGGEDEEQYRKKYKQNFKNFADILCTLFPRAKIFIHKYNDKEAIRFNVDNEYYITEVGKDSVSLLDLLNQDQLSSP